MDIFDLLLPCADCGHGTSRHDGSGCAATACRCTATKELCLQGQIDLEIRDHRSGFFVNTSPA